MIQQRIASSVLTWTTPTPEGVRLSMSQNPSGTWKIEVSKTVVPGGDHSYEIPYPQESVEHLKEDQD